MVSFLAFFKFCVGQSQQNFELRSVTHIDKGEEAASTYGEWIFYTGFLAVSTVQNFALRSVTHTDKGKVAAIMSGGCWRCLYFL